MADLLTPILASIAHRGLRLKEGGKERIEAALSAINLSRFTPLNVDSIEQIVTAQIEKDAAWVRYAWTRDYVSPMQVPREAYRIELTRWGEFA